MENTDYSNIHTLVSLIGKEKDITHQIINHFNTHMTVTPDILPILSLLLIENRFSMVEVIQNILLEYPHLVKDYLSSLQASKFYNQRCAVPRIIVKIPNTHIYLRKALKDDTGLVVKEAVDSLKLYDIIPLEDDELLEVAMRLNNHQYEYIQCLVPDVIIFIKQKTFLLSELSLAKSWRKRLSLVKKILYFNTEDIYNIYNIMSRDSEESVRLALVDQLNVAIMNQNSAINMPKNNMADIPQDDQNILSKNNKISSPNNCISKFSQNYDMIKKYAEIFLLDKSENVRSLLIKKIGNYLDESSLNNVVDDPSWLVKKELLCIHREDIYEKISLPIIKSLPRNHQWRIKIEILETIMHIVRHNDILVRKCLLETFFEYLADSVYEVRKKAGIVLIEIIFKDWSFQLQEKLESFLNSSYLVKITLVEAYLEFDKKYKTRFIKKLLVDKVVNVRLKVLNVLQIKDLDEEMKEIIKDEKDESLQEDVVRLTL